MLKAYHANRVVRIPDEKKKDYIALGYKIKDEAGKVLYDPADNQDSVKALHEAVKAKEENIARLEQTIKSLDTQNKELKAKKDEADKQLAEIKASKAPAKK